MLKFYIRQGIVVEKIHEKIHINTVSGWKIIQFLILKNETRLTVNSKKISINYSIMLSMEKRWNMYENL